MESHVNVAKAFSGLLQPSQLNTLTGLTNSSSLVEAVQKFEAFFIQSMLKSMRSASLSTGLFDSDKSNFYRDWHDQQLAGNLASKETFAVAKLLRRQFADNNETPLPTNSLGSDALFKRSSFAAIGRTNESSDATVVASVATSAPDGIDPVKTNLKQLVTKKISENTKILRQSDFSTPEQFVQQVYPYAKQAASKLKTSADVLVAIAALETGWGVHVPKANSGQDSFNYFGIKANNWQGQTVTNMTQEFDGEKMIMIKDNFRAYQSPADSFNDFVEFLLTNPRYQDAIKQGNDSNAFVAELQKAGYATDPNYAKKVHSILNGSILKNAIYSLHETETTEKLVSNVETKNTH